MTHVAHVIDALHLEDMRLVVGEIGVGLDILCHVLEFGTFLQFDIHHAAVDALTEGNGHRERVFHTLLRADADAVSHRHAGTEVSVGELCMRVRTIESEPGSQPAAMTLTVPVS